MPLFKGKAPCHVEDKTEVSQGPFESWLRFTWSTSYGHTTLCQVLRPTHIPLMPCTIFKMHNIPFTLFGMPVSSHVRLESAVFSF